MSEWPGLVVRAVNIGGRSADDETLRPARRPSGMVSARQSSAAAVHPEYGDVYGGGRPSGVKSGGA